MVQDQLNEKLKDMAEDDDMLEDVDVNFDIISGHDGRNREGTEQGKRGKNSSENGQYKCKCAEAETGVGRRNIEDDGRVVMVKKYIFMSFCFLGVKRSLSWREFK